MSVERGPERVAVVLSTDLFQFFTLGTLFLALLYAVRELVVLSLAIIFLFALARLWSRFSLTKLHCQFSGAGLRGFPGDKVQLELALGNEKYLPVALNLHIPLKGGLLTAAGRETISESFSLPRHGFLKWRWTLQTPGRGCYRVGPPRVEGGDIFGFYRRKRDLAGPATVVVYPRPARLNLLATPCRELFGRPGVKSPVEDPVYPVAARDYTPGRPVRYIHWKASARQDRLVEKVFAPSARRRTLLILETGGFHEKGEAGSTAFELTLEVLAALAVRFQKEGSPFGFAANGLPVEGFGAVVPCSGGVDHLSSVLEAMAALGTEPGCSLEEIIAQLPRAGSGAHALLFSFRPLAAGTLTGRLRARGMDTTLVTFMAPPGDGFHARPGGEATYRLGDFLGWGNAGEAWNGREGGGDPACLA